MRSRGLLVLLLFVTIGLGVRPAEIEAQTTSSAVCSAFIQDALRAVGNNCGLLDRNSACYGYQSVLTSFTEPQPENYFSTPNERTSISLISRIATTPLQTALAEWGIALMSVQANLPDSLPGQSVVFMLVGDAEVENAVSPDTLAIPGQIITVTTAAETPLLYQQRADADVLNTVPASSPLMADAISSDAAFVRVVYLGIPGWVSTGALAGGVDLSLLSVITPETRTPGQAFYLRTNVANTECVEAPNSLIVQSPQNIKIDLTANGADIRIGSTVALQTVNLEADASQSLAERFSVNQNIGGLLILTTLDGEAELNPDTPNSEMVPAGQRTYRCLSEVNNLGLDGAENDRQVIDECPWFDQETVTELDLLQFQALEGVTLNYEIELPEPQVLMIDSVTDPLDTGVPTSTPTMTQVIPPPTNTPTFTPTFTPSNTPTFTHTPSNTPTFTYTPSNTPTFTYTPSNTPTFTYTPSNTPTFTYTPSNTPTFTYTPSNTPTFTHTPSNTPTFTYTPSNTPTFTYTPSNTPTFTYTPSNTPTFTYTPSNTPTFTYTPSNTPTFTYTPSSTPTFTYTPSNTPTFTYTPSNTPTFTYTPSNTPTFTYTPSNTPTFTYTPSNTPTFTYTPSNTPTFTYTPSNTPTFTYTPSNTPTFTYTPSNTPTFTYTPSNTPTFTYTPSIMPTLTNSPTFTPTITPSPTGIPGCGTIIANPVTTVDEFRCAIQLANSEVFYPGPTTIELPIEGAFIFTDGFGASNTALPLITSDITINGHSTTLTRSGVGDLRFFNVNGGHLRLNEIVLSGARASGDGGAILAQGALTMNNVSFYANKSLGRGGAIYINVGTLTITDSYFSENSALNGGGALMVRDSTGSISGTQFVINTTDRDGGAILAAGLVTELDITSTTFDDNLARNGGGLSITDDAYVDISLANIVNNTATQTGALGGGGVYIEDTGSARIVNSVIANNTATTFGGGIATQGKLDLIASAVENNGANTVGGIWSCSGAGESTYIEVSAISGSIDTNSGIGFQTCNLDTALVRNTTFSGQGIGIGHTNGSSLTVEFTTIANHSSAGLSSSGGAGITLRNSLLASNDTNCNGMSSITLTGTNVSSDGTCPVSPAMLVQSPGAILLSPFQNNGGPTSSHYPADGSTIRNLITPANCTVSGGAPLGVDQRGAARPAGAGCEPGSVENNTAGGGGGMDIPFFDIPTETPTVTPTATATPTETQVGIAPAITPTLIDPLLIVINTEVPEPTPESTVEVTPEATPEVTAEATDIPATIAPTTGPTDAPTFEPSPTASATLGPEVTPEVTPEVSPLSAAARALNFTAWIARG